MPQRKLANMKISGIMRMSASTTTGYWSPLSAKAVSNRMECPHGVTDLFLFIWVSGFLDWSAAHPCPAIWKRFVLSESLPELGCWSHMGANDNRRPVDLAIDTVTTETCLQSVNGPMAHGATPRPVQGAPWRLPPLQSSLRHRPR